MIALEIPHTGTKAYMPSDLSECDTRQYNEISFLIYELQSGQIDYETFRIKAVYSLLNMKIVDSGKFQELKMANVYQLSELIDSFFEEGDEENPRILKQYYTHNPTKKVRPLISEYHGPTDDFANIKFGEYIDALNFFSEYHETGEIHFLYLLMATLYRKSKPLYRFSKHLFDFSDDCRVQHNENLVEKRASKFQKLYFGEVYGFFLLFASFQKYLSSAKIYWQGRELDLSILFTNSNKGFKSDIPGLGMKSTLYTLAESGVYGPIKELREENNWEILMRMYDLTKRDLDNIAQQEARAAKLNSSK